MKLSGAVITLNEELYLERLLKNMRHHVEEFIVVDSGSSDNTLEIAKQYNCSIYHRQFEDNYADQRNYALDRCRGEWILFLDADEYFEAAFYEKLPSLLQQGEFDAFEVLRNNIFYKKLKNPLYRWYKYRKHGLEYQIKLFKAHCRYEGRLHEKPVHIKKLGRLQEVLIHDKSLARQFYNNWHYSFIRRKKKFHPNKDMQKFNSSSREKIR